MGNNKKRPGIYEQFKDACAAKGTTITRALNDCGRADSNTGQWKAGSFPRLDAAMDLSEHLGISLDELCYGFKKAKGVVLNKEQKEWLAIMASIPKEKREMCIDFLRTHAVIPEKYSDKGKRIS